MIIDVRIYFSRVHPIVQFEIEKTLILPAKKNFFLFEKKNEEKKSDFELVR